MKTSLFWGIPFHLGEQMGGSDISDELGVARHRVNLEAVNTCQSRRHVQALFLGRAITDIAAF